MTVIIDPAALPAGTLLIGLDLVDPFSHLALPATLELVATARQPVCWVPLTRPPLSSPDSVLGEGRSADHKRHRFAYRERELRFYAQALNRPLDALYRQSDTRPFQLALLWLQATEASLIPQFLEASFDRHWRNKLAEDDLAAWASLIQKVGADETAFLDQFEANESPRSDVQAQLAEQAELARVAGLFNAPAYLYDGELFFGRAHLPLLRRRLSDSR